MLPFRDILTSGSAILALSHGRPVIAPAIGCLPETLPADAAILYDPDAPEALGAALAGGSVPTWRPWARERARYADDARLGRHRGETARLYRGRLRRRWALSLTLRSTLGGALSGSSAGRLR